MAFVVKLMTRCPQGREMTTLCLSLCLSDALSPNSTQVTEMTTVFLSDVLS